MPKPREARCATRRVLIFDANDTLWDNNVLFERVIDDFLDWIDHPTLNREQQHRQRGLQQPVEYVERVRQRDPAHHQARHVAFVPLVTGQLTGHRRVAAQHDHQAADPLTVARVHLVRHRGRADLAVGEPLGEASSWPVISRIVVASDAGPAVEEATRDLAGPSGYVVVTLGADGAMVVGPGVSVTHTLDEVLTDVLTVGAGDVHVACLLDAWLGGADWRSAMAEAAVRTTGYVALMRHSEHPRVCAVTRRLRRCPRGTGLSYSLR